MPADFGRCGDPTCNESAVRLFDCAHHCMKMVCLQHLIEHDRLFERNKKQLENIQLELKRLYAIYSSLIDENKIRVEYEQKLDDYKRLGNEVNSLLDNNSNDIEQFRSINEKLKKMINEKQKASGDSLTIVKVEPIEENSALTTNSEKDESLFIGFDRLQNLIIDTDYHRRKANENTAARTKPENPTVIDDDDDDDDDGDCPINSNTQNHRIAGVCPLWTNGVYGLNKKYHSIRLCRKKRFTDLSNHIRQFHGILAPLANMIAKAVYTKVPTTKRLIPNDLQVADPRRSFLCPFRTECSNEFWLPAMSLRTHLIDVHHMNQSMADIKVRKIKKLNKNKPMSKMRNKVYDIIEKIELASKD